MKLKWWKIIWRNPNILTQTAKVRSTLQRLHRFIVLSILKYWKGKKYLTILNDWFLLLCHASEKRHSLMLLEKEKPEIGPEAAWLVLVISLTVSCCTALHSIRGIGWWGCVAQDFSSGRWGGGSLRSRRCLLCFDWTVGYHVRHALAKMALLGLRGQLAFFGVMVWATAVITPRQAWT